MKISQTMPRLFLNEMNSCCYVLVLRRRTNHKRDAKDSVDAFYDLSRWLAVEFVRFRKHVVFNKRVICVGPKNTTLATRITSYSVINHGCVSAEYAAVRSRCRRRSFGWA